MYKSQTLIMHERAIRALEEELRKANASKNPDMHLIESIQKSLEAHKKWAREEEMKSGN